MEYKELTKDKFINELKKVYLNIIQPDIYLIVIWLNFLLNKGFYVGIFNLYMYNEIISGFSNFKKVIVVVLLWAK